MPAEPWLTIRQFFSSPDSQVGADDREHAFFSRIRLPNGVFKTTARRRMDDVNTLVANHLPDKQTVRVMDVAISSGVSTVEWYESLNASERAIEMSAGDLTLSARLASWGSGFHVLSDTNGFVLQIDCLGVAFPNASGSRWRNAVFKMLRLLVSPLRLLPHSQKPMSLVTPDLLTLADDIKLLDDDILAPCPDELAGQFDVLRAANILNRSYFDEATLTRMLRNLKRRLCEEGLIVIVRSDESMTNHGVIARLSREGDWNIVERFGDASDAEALLGVCGD